MSFHTIFFDLDGTLTDSAPGVLACVRYALDKLGVDPTGRDTAENFIGPPLMTSFTAQYAFDEAAARQAVAYYRERYSTVGLFENSVYPGVTNMLAALQQAGKQLVLATSKPEVFTLRILDHFDLAMVGDRATDILAGHACGMTGVGVLYGGGSRRELTDAGADLLAAGAGVLTPLLLA